MELLESCSDIQISINRSCRSHNKVKTVWLASLESNSSNHLFLFTLMTFTRETHFRSSSGSRENNFCSVFEKQMKLFWQIQEKEQRKVIVTSISM